jgi:multidrug efflux pump subunit AcrB
VTADDQLRSLAVQLREAIAEVNDVSEVTIIGGRPRQVRVDIDPARLSAYDLDPLSVQQAIARTNVRGTASGPVAGGLVAGLEPGSRLRTADDLRNTVVTAGNGRPVLVRDLAEVVDGDAEPASYVTFQSKASGAQPAVTIAVAKRKGTNATDVASRVLAKLDTLKGRSCHRTCISPSPATMARPPQRRATNCSGTCCSPSSRSRRSSGWSSAGARRRSC